MGGQQHGGGNMLDEDTERERVRGIILIHVTGEAST